MAEKVIKITGCTKIPVAKHRTLQAKKLEFMLPMIAVTRVTSKNVPKRSVKRKKRPSPEQTLEMQLNIAIPAVSIARKTLQSATAVDDSEPAPLDTEPVLNRRGLPRRVVAPVGFQYLNVRQMTRALIKADANWRRSRMPK